MSSKHSLELAEYSAMALSAIGSVAATISSQVAYAALPLTATLFLNAVNRDRGRRQQAESIVTLKRSIAQSPKNLTIDEIDRKICSIFDKVDDL